MPAGPVAGEGAARHDPPDAVEALRRSEARFRATFEQAGVGMAHVGLDGRFLLVNRRLCDITGFTAAELTSRSFQDITHRDDLHGDVEQATRLAAGEIASYSLEKRFLRRDGSTLWVRLTRSCVRRADGTPDFFVSVHEDIDRQKRAEEALRFLAEAGRVLTASLDTEVVMSTLLRLVVPRIGDYAIVDLMEDGVPVASRTLHSRPEKAAALRDYRRRYPATPRGARSVLWQVLESGEPRMVRDLTPAALAGMAADPGQAELLAVLGPTSFATVPLAAPGRTLGTLSICVAESGRAIADDEVQLARELAGRAAVALDHARLLARLRRDLGASSAVPTTP